MRLKNVIGGLLLATVSAFALASGTGPAEAGPPGGCPPGLAKKNPPCIPPGQAKKFYRGEYIPDHVHYDIIRYDRYGLPPPPSGHSYVRIGRDAYLIAEGTQRVIEAINLFDAVGR